MQIKVHKLRPCGHEYREGSIYDENLFRTFIPIEISYFDRKHGD
jgi:hypothetical protein